MCRILSLNRFAIASIFLVMFLGSVAIEAYSARVLVSDGDLVFETSDTTADCHFFLEKTTDRSGAHLSERLSVPGFHFKTTLRVPAKEGVIVMTPIWSFFLSNSFYIFLTSLAP